MSFWNSQLTPELWLIQYPQHCRSSLQLSIWPSYGVFALWYKNCFDVWERSPTHLVCHYCHFGESADILSGAWIRDYNNIVDFLTVINTSHIKISSYKLWSEGKSIQSLWRLDLQAFALDVMGSQACLSNALPIEKSIMSWLVFCRFSNLHWQ